MGYGVDTSGWTCKYCSTTGEIVLVWKTELVAKPLGTWSLSGMQNKANCVEVSWPWAVCKNCGHESKGKR